MKHSFSFRYGGYPALVYAIFVTVILLNTVSSYAGPRKEVLQTRKMLTAQLDSIEMEKQIRKRSGESLEDLEQESGRIHDSLASLRIVLVGEDAGQSGLSEDSEENSFFDSIVHSLLKPARAFDWVIIVIGIIALLSGIVLLSGMVYSLFSRVKKSVPSSSPRTQKKKGDADRLSQSIQAPPAQGRRAGGDIETMDISSLRKRMSKDIDHIQRFNKESSPFSAADETQNEQDNSIDLRNRIIHAAQEGLDTQEISRRYHVSVDQVALILRVAEKGH